MIEIDLETKTINTHPIPANITTTSSLNTTQRSIHTMHIFSLLLLVLTVPAQARWQLHKPRDTQAKGVDSATASKGTIAMFNITLPLDHNGTTAETFENRYWVDDSYWVPGGPIMRMSPCSPNSVLIRY